MNTLPIYNTYDTTNLPINSTMAYSTYQSRYPSGLAQACHVYSGPFGKLSSDQKYCDHSGEKIEHPAKKSEMPFLILFDLALVVLSLR